MKEADRSRLINDPFPDVAFWDEETGEQQTALAKRNSKFAQSRETGAVFEASGPGFFDANPLFQKARQYPHYYFREVRPEKQPWWRLGQWRLRRTGRVWRPHPGTFRIFNDAAHALRYALKNTPPPTDTGKDE